MFQAIDAVPAGLGIVTAATAALFLMPARAVSPPPPVPEVMPERVEMPVVQTQPMDRCAGARGIVLTGRVTGGPSHVRLAGPVIYSDVMTDREGRFELRIPIEAASEDVCALLPGSTTLFRFTDEATTVEYKITIER
jgi:hypothetical protein